MGRRNPHIPATQGELEAPPTLLDALIQPSALPAARRGTASPAKTTIAPPEQTLFSSPS